MSFRVPIEKGRESSGMEGYIGHMGQRNPSKLDRLKCAEQ